MAVGNSTLNSKEKPQHTQSSGDGGDGDGNGEGENSRVFALELTGEIEWKLTSILIRKQLD